MTQRRSGTSGLSLVEVLVALAVFSIIGIAAFAMLDQTLRSERLAGARLARLADVQRMMQVLTIDTMQAISGTITRDNTGISFLRRGSVAKDGVAGVEGLAVRYHLDKAGLIREIGAPGAAPAEQVLLSDVQSANWKLIQGVDAAMTETAGVELALQLADHQTLRGVFPLPHDQIPPVAP
ncbi:MAG: prepilin-type N-terminal cleavage/methylation domain-containing protein [Paracoccaceae bacterium]